MQRVGQVILGLCVVFILYLLALPEQVVGASQPLHLLYQSSPLSPLSQPVQASAGVTDNLAAVASAVNRTNQTSLLLVAIVLVGILVVIGLVMWRQR